MYKASLFLVIALLLAQPLYAQQDEACLEIIDNCMICESESTCMECMDGFMLEDGIRCLGMEEGEELIEGEEDLVEGEEDLVEGEEDLVEGEDVLEEGEEDLVEGEEQFEGEEEGEEGEVSSGSLLRNVVFTVVLVGFIGFF